MRFRSLAAAVAVIAALLPITPAVAGGVPTTRYVDINDGACDNSLPSDIDNPFCDIEAAVDIANPGDTVEVAAGVYLDHDADNYVVNITVPVTIIGAGVGNTVINGNNDDIGVRVWDVAPVTITGVTITNADGGGVLVTGDGGLTLRASEVKDSLATTGAGFYVYAGATVELDGVTVASNTATTTGGGVFIAAAGTDVDIIDSTFSLNTSGTGGAIAFSGGAGTLDISGSEFLDNDANAAGGAISLQATGSTTHIDTTVFHNNGDDYQGGGTDTGTGGAIYMNIGTLVVDQSLFYENDGDSGGAIWATPATVTVRNTTIHDNYAKDQGGAIWGFTGVLENSTITGNTTDGYIGGIDALAVTPPTVRNSIIAGNTAPNCDAIDLAHYSIIGDSTACSITTNVGTLVDTDPQLLTLANNGGPTMTRAFEPGAPPHDAGDPAEPGTTSNSCQEVDQRRFDRHGSRCDVGAFELVEPTVTRLSGSNRFATAVDISAEFWPDGADRVIIANGEGFPDALTAANLYDKNAPLLLVSSDSIPAATATELDRLGPNTIYVLGGTAVVSDAVATELEGWGTVERLSGSNRYGTNVAITQEAFPGGVDTVFVASGVNFPDALAGGPATIGEAGALLITDPNSLPGAIGTEIGRLDPSQIYVLGGTSAVSADVLTALEAIAPTTRVSGANRFATAVAISDMFFDSAGTVLTATAFNFPDALAGSLASGGTAPLLLVGVSTLPSVVADEITAFSAKTIFVLGGISAIDTTVFAALEALIGA